MLMLQPSLLRAFLALSPFLIKLSLHIQPFFGLWFQQIKIMEAKRKALAVGLLFMAVLSFTLYLLHSPQLQHGLAGEIKNIINGFLGVFPTHPKYQNQTHPGSSPHNLSPNLSSCHKSYAYAGFLVNCCPPIPHSSISAVGFTFPSTDAVRIRRPTHRLDADYIAKYNKALSIMKSLPESDPRSFTRQASLHCLYCTGAYDQSYTSAEPSPLNIHSNWLFYPWHRMLLYFHERILGHLIGDDTFALPYWPWDVPEAMTAPSMYQNAPFHDPDRDTAHLPPSIVDLNYWWTEKGLNPKDQIDSNLALMYNQMVSGAKKSELFLGCEYKSGPSRTCDGPGTIELAPHDMIHAWIGSNLKPGRQDMGLFYSAARDPVFYAHHSNVDRLWELWRDLNGHNLDVFDRDWLETHFYFYDYDLRLVKIKIRDVLDRNRLGYAYEEIETPWLNARPKPSVSPELARHVLKTRFMNRTRSKRILHSDFGPRGEALSRSVTVEVARPKINRTREEKEKEEEVIVIHGIQMKEDVAAKFDVFVNLVDEVNASPLFREFAGTFVHIPRGVNFDGGRMMKREMNLKLGVSELLEDLNADSDESVWVTLLPRAKSCVNVTVEGIRIEYIR